MERGELDHHSVDGDSRLRVTRHDCKSHPTKATKNGGGLRSIQNASHQLAAPKTSDEWGDSYVYVYYRGIVFSLLFTAKKNSNNLNVLKHSEKAANPVTGAT